jgi:DNA-binding MarR family transcriptional regulator
VAADPAIAEALERIVFAGVAVTTLALSDARPALDLTLPQWRVLVVLGNTVDGAIVSDISAWIRVTLPATSRQLHRLERRGLVSLATDERDRRAMRVRLTDEGRAARSAVISYRHRRIAESVQGLELGPTAADDLNRIADALEGIR